MCTAQHCTSKKTMKISLFTTFKMKNKENYAVYTEQTETFSIVLFVQLEKP